MNGQLTDFLYDFTEQLENGSFRISLKFHSLFIRRGEVALF
jgi:hypothetical protein